MAKKKVAPKTYATHVKSALENCSAPAWLGEHSPLATPYFLGEQLHGTEATAVARGTVLLQEIERTLQTLWRGPLPDNAATMLEMVEAEEDEGGRGDRYDCLILELNYLKRIFRPAPKSQAEIYNDILHISRPTHDRHLAGAVERLATILLQRLRPAVRPEQPQSVPTLIGRETLQAQILADLEKSRSVSLSGSGGVGKTTLGAAIPERWHSPAVFWFTFRATLNDHMDSLLFALGHFLHTWGASTLWHQLIADGGQLRDGSLALGLLRTDLAALGHPPLLCFDEMDVLRPATADQPGARHVQLLELIDSLRQDTALLLLGQRPFWESDAVYTLTGLAESEVDALLASFSIPHSAEDVARLHYYSGGNPRLVELCAALYSTERNESFSSVLDGLPQSPTLLPLWHRLARRLTQAERRLLQELSVFRTSAPADAWQERAQANEAQRDEESERAEALAQLIERRLVRQDHAGGIALLPALSEVVYTDLAVEQREQYHVQAAVVRAERGDYTAAAHHLHRADQPDMAVALWYTHRTEEIHRGQAGAAQAIFDEISLRRLSSKRQKELRLLRSELYQLRGEPEQVIQALEPISWAPEEPEQVDAALLLGKAFDQQSRSDAALNTYAAGINAATVLLSKTVQLHVQRSLIRVHERDIGQAWHEANRARYLAENMLGTVHEQSGDLAAAQRHYQTALEIAQQIDYPTGTAKTYHNLGNLASRQLKIPAAVEYYERAIATYETMGDRVGVEIARSGLVTTYMQAGRYAEALRPARRALTFFQAMGDAYWIALNAANLAEAYTELEEFDDAEAHAMLVLDQEEPDSHPYALFSLGQIRQKREQWQEAELYFKQARAVAAMNEDRYLLAYCWEELGKIAQAQGQQKHAQEAFANARHQFHELGIVDKVDAMEELAFAIDTIDA